eukprot:822184-Pelagomonas_calceolata.AAC.8
MPSDQPPVLQTSPPPTHTQALTDNHTPEQSRAPGWTPGVGPQAAFLQRQQGLGVYRHPGSVCTAQTPLSGAPAVAPSTQEVALLQHSDL